MAWDVQSWSQAFSMYASALMSANSTTKPESAGLLAHTFSVLQFAGWQPMAWATAKIKDLRTIFCQCMVSQQRVLPIAQQLESGSSFSEIWGCLVWNFKKVCKNQDVDSPAAATSVEDLIGAPTVCHGQAKVVVDRVERSDTSLLISLVL